MRTDRSVVRPWLDLRGDGRGWVLLAVSLGWFGVLGTRFVVPALLPEIKAEFVINNTTAGFAITLIWATYAAMQFPAGVLVDRVGERIVLVASVAFTGVSLLLLGGSPLFLLFLATCVAFGLGTGLYGPARAMVISRAYPDRDGTAFGFVLASGSAGAAAVPFVATLIAVRFGWRAAFAALAPLFLVLVVGIARAVPARETPGRDDGGSVRRRIAAVRQTISRRPVTIATAANTIMLFGFQGLTAFFPTYLVATKSVDASTAGGLFALLFVSAAVFRLVAGGAADRYGFGRTLAAIAAASVLSLAALPFTTGLLPLALVSILLGLRSGAGPVSEAYIVRLLPDEVQGTSWGLLRTAFFAVGATGAVFVGTLADAGWFDGAFLALAALTVGAVVLYLALPPRDAGG